VRPDRRRRDDGPRRRQPHRGGALILRAGSAAGAGLLLALAFPPADLPWLAVVAVAILTLAVRGVRARAGFGLGLIAGLAFFALLLRWMTVIGTDAWLALSAYCALWLGLVGLASALLQRGLRSWPLWVALAWVLQESLRGRVPWGGFPWGRLAFAQADTLLTPYAAVGGAPLVTFTTALLGTLLAYAAVAARARRLRPVAAAAVGAVATCLVAVMVPLPAAGEVGDGPATATAAVVQGSVPALGMGAFDQRRAVLDNHVTQTIRLAQRVADGEVPAPQLVVWPENASDLDPYTLVEAYRAIDTAVRAIDAPTLVGTVIPSRDDPARVWNVGIVWDPVTGPGERYVKRQPVPFGEYVPFRPLLARFISRFDRVPRDFAPGDGPGVLQLGPARIGDVICFEIAYDGIVRDAVVAGGRLLVVQTNNATYGLTGQPEQQLAMSRLRAIEHGRAVLVAATSGISAVISPDGGLTQWLPEQAAGSLVADVPLRDTLTVADRLGPWPELIAGLATLGACVVAWRRRRVGSVDGTTGVPADGAQPVEEGEPA
jgi:apolipoprotein N-acyltransferase